MRGHLPCFGCSISFHLFLMFHGLWSACGACIDGFLVPRKVPRPAAESRVCPIWLTRGTTLDDFASRWRRPGKQIRLDWLLFLLTA